MTVRKEQSTDRIMCLWQSFATVDRIICLDYHYRLSFMLIFPSSYFFPFLFQLLSCMRPSTLSTQLEFFNILSHWVTGRPLADSHPLLMIHSLPLIVMMLDIRHLLKDHQANYVLWILIHSPLQCSEKQWYTWSTRKEYLIPGHFCCCFILKLARIVARKQRKNMPLYSWTEHIFIQLSVFQSECLFILLLLATSFTFFATPNFL